MADKLARMCCTVCERFLLVLSTVYHSIWRKPLSDDDNGNLTAVTLWYKEITSLWSAVEHEQVML